MKRYRLDLLPHAKYILSCTSSGAAHRGSALTCHLRRGGLAEALLGLADQGEDPLLDVLTQVLASSLSVRQTEELVRRTKAGKATRKTVKELPSALEDLQDRLARHLGTRVKVKPRARGEGGKIVLVL